MAQIINHGTKKFPHWHDAKEWVKHTTMTRSKFLSMTPEQFADWVFDHRNFNDAQGFFYGSQWPEGYSYCMNREYVLLTAYPGLLRRRENWPDELL